jgi:hypothetical protein
MKYLREHLACVLHNVTMFIATPELRWWIAFKHYQMVDDKYGFSGDTIEALVDRLRNEVREQEKQETIH